MESGIPRDAVPAKVQPKAGTPLHCDLPRERSISIGIAIHSCKDTAVRIVKPWQAPRSALTRLSEHGFLRPVRGLVFRTNQVPTRGGFDLPTVREGLRRVRVWACWAATGFWSGPLDCSRLYRTWHMALPSKTTRPWPKLTGLPQFPPQNPREPTPFKRPIPGRIVQNSTSWARRTPRRARAAATRT